VTPEPGRDAVGWVDARTGAAPLLRKALRYVFPEHWSFLLGEIALYSFVVLVGSGVFLALFFTDDTSQRLTYDGSYAPLRGFEVTKSYDSALNLSFEVPGGLLMRQTHHWGALVFLVAIVMHLLRVFFTGAFRRPRELTWVIGVTLLALAVVEGFAGYSLPDDLLSGMGLAIAYSVAAAIPVVGGEVASAVWGGQYPGPGVIHDRLYILHVFILPAAIATLIALHLALIMRTHHTQFRGRGRREDNTVGAPAWPTYAFRSLGLLAATAAVLVLLGGLVQINPVWQWGPNETALSTNGAQPDWYLGWLIGGLRLMPSFEPTIFGRTPVPNPFWGGLGFPTVVFVILYAYPFVEKRLARDRREHHLLDRPRDHPWRSAFGAALFTWVAVIFIAGSADRMFLQLGWSYESQVWTFRALAFVAPAVAFAATKATCEELRRSGVRPLRGPQATVRRADGGGFEVVAGREPERDEVPGPPA
jgi:ubiquinol-cytochrome c reductase cytochrome b subunit